MRLLIVTLDLQVKPKRLGKGEMSSLFGFLSSSDVFKKEYDMDPKGESPLANFDDDDDAFYLFPQIFNSRDSRALLCCHADSTKRI
jgi:hypothetical protein